MYTFEIFLNFKIISCIYVCIYIYVSSNNGYVIGLSLLKFVRCYLNCC